MCGYGMGNGHYGAKDLGIVVSDESLSVIVGRSVEFPNMGEQIALISRKDIDWQSKLKQSLVSALASGSSEWKAYWDNTP